MVPADQVEEARGRFGQLAEILSPPRALAGVPPKYQPSVYRLFAMTLPYDTVAYVDSDAIFCAPAPELWETEAGKWNVTQDGGAIGGEHGAGSDAGGVLAAIPGDCGEESVFNSGVFALRPAEWRDLPGEFRRTLAANWLSDVPSDLRSGDTEWDQIQPAGRNGCRLLLTCTIFSIGRFRAMRESFITPPGCVQAVGPALSATRAAISLLAEIWH